MCVFDPFSLNRAICVSIGLQLYIVTLSHHQWVYNWKQPFPLSLSLSVKKNSSPVRDRVHKSLLHLCLTIGRTILWWPRAGIKRYSKFMIVITVSCPEDDNLQLFSHIIYLLLLSDSILRIWTFLLYKCSATTQKGKKSQETVTTTKSLVFTSLFFYNEKKTTLLGNVSNVNNIFPHCLSMCRAKFPW